MQFLAEIEKSVERPKGNMCSPGTDGVFKGSVSAKHSIRFSSKTYPKGEWVKAERIVLGDAIGKHIINGAFVLA